MKRIRKSKINHDKFIELFYTNSLSTKEVAIFFGVSPITIADYRWRHNLPKRGWAGGIHPRGTLGKIPWNKGKKVPETSKENNPNWKGGRYLSKGYIMVHVGDHPFASKYYYKEHRFVMEQHLGRYLSRSEKIHHINGIKTDNRIENLMLFQGDSEHSKLHYPKGSYFGQNTKLNKS